MQWKVPVALGGGRGNQCSHPPPKPTPRAFGPLLPLRFTPGKQLAERILIGCRTITHKRKVGRGMGTVVPTATASHGKPSSCAASSGSTHDRACTRLAKVHWYTPLHVQSKVHIGPQCRCESAARHFSARASGVRPRQATALAMQHCRDAWVSRPSSHASWVWPA